MLMNACARATGADRTATAATAAATNFEIMIIFPQKPARKLDGGRLGVNLSDRPKRDNKPWGRRRPAPRGLREPAIDPAVGRLPHSGARFHLREAGKSIEHALDALNFFLADVRDGLGPYLSIYLLTEQKWDEASIGVVMSVAALAGIIAQTPAGALIDRSTPKRALMVGAAVVVTLTCLVLPLIHGFALVAVTQALAAAAGAIFAPAI